MAKDQQRLQSLSSEYQKLQDGTNPPPVPTPLISTTDLQTTVSALQTLQSQQAENLAVQREFAGLGDDNQIYKLIGGVLLKQDKADATSTVNGRLEFIGKEIKSREARVKELQEGSENKRADVMAIQQHMQQGQTEGKG